MTIRPEVPSPFSHRDRRKETPSDDPVWRAECLKLWDRGFDTSDIAQMKFAFESEVDKGLRRAREQRRHDEQGKHAAVAAPDVQARVP